MNRRKFLGSGLAAGIYSSSSGMVAPIITAEERQHNNAGAAFTTPSWLTQQPIVMAGCWDDFPLFQKRLGGSPLWLDDLYRTQSSEATVKALKDAGITLAVIHFFKGFGLKAESEHIADARKLSRQLHQNGIRVGLYVGSTIAYETFLVEEPEAEEWLVQDYIGKPVYYADQTFRRRVYMMHPGYRNYIKRVVRYGIENLDADLIHFDNTSQQAQPSVFQHPLAVKDFQAYLSTTYSGSELKDRFGTSDVRYIRPPRIEINPVRLNDPLLQTWVEFRAHQLNSYYAEMTAFIRSIKPSVAVDNNPSSGISGDHIIWEQGVDYPRLLNEVDIAWSEEGDSATVTEEGVLVSKIKTFKAAASLNRRIFCYTWGADGSWGYQENGGSLLQMAESMAYNRQCLGMVGIFNAIHNLKPEARQYIRFFHDNFGLYRDITTIADVALFYSFSSMGFSQDRPTSSYMQAAQTLIQGRIPFDIIFDQQLENISKYKVLFLADQECLSDLQLQTIKNFVMQGGGLVATEHTSLFTERRERRPDFGLKELLGVSAPPWRGSATQEAILSGGSIQTNAGHGKVIYVPEIIPTVVNMNNPANKRQHLWALPANYQEIYDAVKSAMNGQFAVQVLNKVSNRVTMELVGQNNGGRMIMHLLNYDYKKVPSVENLQFSIKIPNGKRISNVRALSPDNTAQHTIIPTIEKDGAIFTVPSLSIYTVVVIDLV